MGRESGVSKAKERESELGERERGWGVSAGRFKWGECSEWGARERVERVG